jgi:guanylate kinase
VLLVLAGPSGVGKGTIVDGLRARHPELWESVSYTSRARRPREVEGQDYRFVTREEFEKLRDAGGFLEWFEVFGDLKGTPRAPVEEHLAAGDDVLLEIDVQGALKVREMFPEAVLVFVKPPSPEELRQRLESRGTETPEDLDRRLAAAAAEEAQAGEFDAVVVNDDVDRAVAEVAGILAGSLASPSRSENTGDA